MAAPNRRGRVCPIEGCSRELRNADAFLCASHWYSLPEELRDRIWRSFRGGCAGTDEHYRLIVEALMLAES